jgi:hypothetical protein
MTASKLRYPAHDTAITDRPIHVGVSVVLMCADLGGSGGAGTVDPYCVYDDGNIDGVL